MSVPEKICYEVPVVCFQEFIVILLASQDFFLFFFSYHGPNASLTDVPCTRPESQFVIVNRLNIKQEIALDFDAERS